MKSTGLNIKAVSQLSGVSVHTIRAWEKRYQAVSPERSQTGRRLYSLNEVERIRLLMKAVSQGCTISQVAALSNVELRSRVRILHDGFSDSWSRGSRVSAVEACDQVFEALCGFRVCDVQRVLSHARRHFETEEFVFDLVLPLLKKCGDASQKKGILEAQVGALRVIVRNELSRLLVEQQEKAMPDFPEVMIALSDEGTSEIEGVVSALLVTLRGYSTLYLGSGLSSEALIEAANARRVRALLVHTPYSGDHQIERSLFKALTQLDLGLLPAIEIWLNGPALESALAFKWKHRVRHFARFEDFEELAGSAGRQG